MAGKIKQAKIATDTTVSREEAERKEKQRQAYKDLPPFLLTWIMGPRGVYRRRFLTPTQHKRLLEREGRVH